MLYVLLCCALGAPRLFLAPAGSAPLFAPFRPASPRVPAGSLPGTPTAAGFPAAAADLAANVGFPGSSPHRLPAASVRAPIPQMFQRTPRKDPRGQRSRLKASTVKENKFLADAWARYVLLRPGMDMEQLRNSTRFRTARSWTWEERTPGTARTLLFTAVTISLFAIPLFFANPQVLERLLGAVALSLQGESATEYYVEEATEFVPQISNIFEVTKNFIAGIFGFQPRL